MRKANSNEKALTFKLLVNGDDLEVDKEMNYFKTNKFKFFKNHPI